MSSLDRDYFDELINGLADIKNAKLSSAMSDIYYAAFEMLDANSFLVAIQKLLDDKFFPTPERVREVATGQTVDRDWDEIVAVASGNKSSAEISGIAEITMKSIGGLKKIACANDKETLALKERFLKLLSVPPDPKALPPARVTISVGVEERGNDREYPIDWDFSVRTASLIRLLNKREIKTSTAIAMCSRFPECKKAEVMAVVEQIEETFKSLSLEIDKVNKLVMGIF